MSQIEDLNVKLRAKGQLKCGGYILLLFLNCLLVLEGNIYRNLGALNNVYV